MTKLTTATNRGQPLQAAPDEDSADAPAVAASGAEVAAEARAYQKEDRAARDDARAQSGDGRQRAASRNDIAQLSRTVIIHEFVYEITRY